MSRYRIALDVDGVLADFVEGLRDFVAAQTGTRPTTSPDSWDHLASWGNPVTWADVAAHASEICAGLSWYPGAQEVLAHLDRDHDVAFCTTPMNAEWLRARARWLEFAGFPLSRQVHVSDKSWIAADVLIDDGVHNLTTFRGRGLCIARPWNVHCPLPIPRIDLRDVFDYLR
jgi:5'(3')-deoxyribonucleotidase